MLIMGLLLFPCSCPDEEMKKKVPPAPEPLLATTFIFSVLGKESSRSLAQNINTKPDLANRPGKKSTPNINAISSSLDAHELICEQCERVPVGISMAGSLSNKSIFC